MFHITGVQQGDNRTIEYLYAMTIDCTRIICTLLRDMVVLLVASNPFYIDGF